MLFLPTFKKVQKKAKWPNHFISGKQFQKRPSVNPAALFRLSSYPSPSLFRERDEELVIFCKYCSASLQFNYIIF